MAEETMRGRLHFFFEQGYEGPPWGFQDDKHIHKDETMPHGERWDWGGTHILQLGDRLKVSTADGEVIFDNELLFGSSRSHNLWYPKGISQKSWEKLFSEKEKLIVELTPSAPKRVKTAVSRIMPGESFLRIESFEDWTIKDGMGSDVFTYIVIVLKYFSSGRKPTRFQLYFIPRQSICGCRYKKPGDNHICICDRLPEDILSGVKPL